MFTQSKLMHKFLLFSSVLFLPIATSTAIQAQENGHQTHFSQPLLVAQAATKADPFFLTRAKNLARQAAERENGGLSQYRAEAAMYGPAIDSTYVENEDGSVTFSFKGGAPGFTTPTVETVATVTPEGAVTLGYNGPLRPASAGQVAPEPSITPTDQVAPAAPAPVEQPPTTPPAPAPPADSAPIIDQLKDLVQ